VDKLLKYIKLGGLAFVYVLLCCRVAYADDIEVFFNNKARITAGNPNILFVFDTSASMNLAQSYQDVVLPITYDINGDPITTTVIQSRLGILQDVLSEFFSSQSNVNMGMARFSQPGGPILYPVSNPDDPASPVVYTSISSASDDATQSGQTVFLSTPYLDPIKQGNRGFVGLRFTNVNVPQGATILKATLQLSAEVDSLVPGADYEIYAELVPNATPFLLENNNIGGRIAGSKSVLWSAPPWDVAPIVDPLTDPPTTFETPDISTVLQDVVNIKGTSLSATNGWCGGNDLVIVLKQTGTTERPIISYDNKPDFAPKLRIDFDANIPGTEFGCYANTIVRQVSSSEADSESGSGNFVDADLDFYRDDFFKETNTSIALSFKDVAVPNGAVITDAKLKFTSRDASVGIATSMIVAINKSNPEMANLAHNVPPLFWTPTATIWEIPTWDFGIKYDSADISSIITTLVNLPTWGAGNPDGSIQDEITFLLLGGIGNRSAYSYDGSISRAPELEVTYKGRYQASAATRRQEMLATVEDFKGIGLTPLADVYAEAALYYKGEPVTYGLVRGQPTFRDYRISHVDSVINGLINRPPGCSESNLSDPACVGEQFFGAPLYKTPIQNACQANHIVLLTDGDPTSIDPITNNLYARWTTDPLTLTSGACASNDNGKDCTIKMAGLLKNNDLFPATPDKETITTHTIGFLVDSPFLQSVAEAGGGEYVTASDKQELLDAITKVVDSILDTNTTFVSAGVTVNQYNRLTHNDQLYFSLFSPSSETVWPGNLKRYRLLNGELVDVNANPAVNLSGEFDEISQSWWSIGVDGNQVELGGAAGQMTNNRRVFSNLSLNPQLSDMMNAVEPFNPLITEPMIGAINPMDRDLILRWVKGQDVNASDPASQTLPRQRMGDPLHSQPTLLIYRVGADVFKTSIYVGSNEGYIHSFDTETGGENWAFIPRSLMPRLSEIQKDTLGTHTYGIDGSVTLHIEDVDIPGNYPGVVDPGEKAYLYIGMRRGGSSYYALDVSDPMNPILMFTIDPTVPGFADLGQTWSKPVIGKMNIPGHETVMIFGGGYSTIQDMPDTPPQIDWQGKNIYIADAITGQYLWSAKPTFIGPVPIMTLDAPSVPGSLAGSFLTMNAIPNEVTAFDLDGDDFIDHFYATDTMAQIFRFDIDYTSNSITGGRVAHLNLPDPLNNRRFYNGPDVSLVGSKDGSFVTIAVGSGYRAHPLNETVTDHFYVVQDKGILSRKFDMDASIMDLADVTNLIGDANGDGISDAAQIINDPLLQKKGWYISFPRLGEKVISKSITFNNAVIFTTYTPPPPTGAICTAVAGTSRIYGMNILDGNPYIDTNYDGKLSVLDRTMDLTTSGIAPQPQVLLEGTSTGVKTRLCVGNLCGLEKFLPEPPEGVMGIRWRRGN